MLWGLRGAISIRDESSEYPKHTFDQRTVIQSSMEISLTNREYNCDFVVKLSTKHVVTSRIEAALLSIIFVL